MDMFREYIFGNRADSDQHLVQSIDELNKASEHVSQLVKDACLLYLNGSYPSSAFLSITVCEEAAKVIYGDCNGKLKEEKPRKRERNVFTDHRLKHLLVSETNARCKLLEDAIGEKELNRIIEMANSGKLAKARMRSLYYERKEEGIVIPSEKIDKGFARVLFLFAIILFEGINSIWGPCDEHYYYRETIANELFEKARKT